MGNMSQVIIKPGINDKEKPAPSELDGDKWRDGHGEYIKYIKLWEPIPSNLIKHLKEIHNMFYGNVQWHSILCCGLNMF